MEKFIIRAAYRCSGEIVPAGNKNAALPILAACLLTEEELVVRNVPRIRDVESHARRCSSGSASSVAWTGDNERPPAAPTTDHRHRGRRGARQADPRLVPARRPAAGPLRRGEDARRRAATRSAGAGSTPTSTPSATSAPRSTATSGSSSRRRRRAAAEANLHGRALGDGDRERADGRRAARRARRRSPTPPASRTSRTSPGCWCKMGAEVDGIGSNVMTVHGARPARRRRARRSAPTTSRSAASWPSRGGVTGGELRIAIRN